MDVFLGHSVELIHQAFMKNGLICYVCMYICMYLCMFICIYLLSLATVFFAVVLVNVL